MVRSGCRCRVHTQLSRTGSNFCIPILIAVVFIAMVTTTGHAHGDDGCSGDHKQSFTSFRKKFIENRQSPAPVAVQAVTSFLSPGDDARIVFRRVAAEINNERFRVFETNGIDPKFESLRDVPVLSVAKAPEKLVTGFLPGDSYLIRLKLEEDNGRYWAHRSFVILRCVDGQVKDWAILRARVSANPIATGAISLVVLLLAYFLAMVALRHARNEPHPLAAKYKYPAYRAAARPIGWNPIHLIADAFNRASVQKLQIILFSSLVGGLLLWLALSNGVLVDLSPTILGLLGISGIGAAVAQTSSAAKDRMSFDNWSWLVKKRILPIYEAREQGPQWRDLVMSNRTFDVYKLQALIFSVAVALALLAVGASGLPTFFVPENLLGILALSQVVFVAGIMVRPPSIEELDKAITNLRKAEETARLAIRHNVDVDASGNLQQPLPAPPADVSLLARKATARNALQNYKELADRAEIMIESTLETTIERRKLDPDLDGDRRMLGPEGGSGGMLFSMDTDDDDMDIHRVLVWAGDYIDAIQITYRHRVTGAQIVAGKIGGPGGVSNEIVLDAGEYVIAVEGNVGQYVDSLAIETNRRRMPAAAGTWLGGPGGQRAFSFRCQEDEQVIGFYGRSGELIDALGAIVRPRR